MNELMNKSSDQWLHLRTGMDQTDPILRYIYTQTRVDRHAMRTGMPSIVVFVRRRTARLYHTLHEIEFDPLFGLILGQREEVAEVVVAEV